MLSNHIICCCPLLLLLSVFPNIRVFSKESVFPMRWPKYWSFRFSISPSYEYSGLISLRINRLDLFALQGTQRVFSNTTVQGHPFFSTQLFLWSNCQMHTGLLGKLKLWLCGPLLAKQCLCFLKSCLCLSSFSSKEQVSFNFMAAFTICSDFGAQEIKVCHCFHVSLSICHEVTGTDAMILVSWMLSFKPFFSLSFSLSLRDSLVPLCFLP